MYDYDDWRFVYPWHVLTTTMYGYDDARRGRLETIVTMYSRIICDDDVTRRTTMVATHDDGDDARRRRRYVERTTMSRDIRRS